MTMTTSQTTQTNPSTKPPSAIMTTPTSQTTQTPATTQSNQTGVCSSLRTLYTKDCEAGVTNEEECLEVLNILEQSCDQYNDNTTSTNQAESTTQAINTTDSMSTTPPTICNGIILLAEDCKRKALTGGEMRKQCEGELSIAKKFCGYDNLPDDNNSTDNTTPLPHNNTMDNGTCNIDPTTDYLLIKATSTCLLSFKVVEHCGFGKNGVDMDQEHCQDIWTNFYTHCGYFEKPCISDLCHDLLNMAEKCAFGSYIHFSDEACLGFAETFKSHCGYKSN